MSRARGRMRLAGALLALAAAPAMAALRADVRAAAVASGRVGAPVVAALEGASRVRVMVSFVAGASAPGAARRRRIADQRAAVMAAVGADQLVVRRTFANVGALAGEITGEGLRRLLARPEVARVDVDAPGRAALAQALPLVHLDDVWSMGFTGAGTTVAVIDSGLDRDHPDLADALVDEACFCSGGGGCCPGGGATQTGAGAAEDDNGHGTNVAGIVTSNGTVAPRGGAPDAQLVAVKVLDADGGFCCSSDVVAAMDWVLADHPETRAVNLSLGTAMLFSGDCDAATAFTMAFADAVAALRQAGILTVVATGNQGSATQMAAPACVAGALSVGAVWDSAVGPVTVLGCTDAATAADLPTCFTNSDATTDVFAPGAPITSTGLGGGTSTYFGTSQATPIVTACAADLVQAEPTLDPPALETLLTTTPTTVVDPKNGLAFPRLDCLAALEAALGVTTTSTTLPSCPEPGLARLRCSFETVLAAVDAAADLGRLQRPLERKVRQGLAQVDAADAAAAAGKERKVARRVKRAGRKAEAIRRKLQSKRAQRLVPESTRLYLVALVDALFFPPPLAQDPS